MTIWGIVVNSFAGSGLVDLGGWGIFVSGPRFGRLGGAAVIWIGLAPPHPLIGPNPPALQDKTTANLPTPTQLPQSPT